MTGPHRACRPPRGCPGPARSAPARARWPGRTARRARPDRPQPARVPCAGPARRAVWPSWRRCPTARPCDGRPAPRTSSGWSAGRPRPACRTRWPAWPAVCSRRSRPCCPAAWRRGPAAGARGRTLPGRRPRSPGTPRPSPAPPPPRRIPAAPPLLRPRRPRTPPGPPAGTPRQDTAGPPCAAPGRSAPRARGPRRRPCSRRRVWPGRRHRRRSPAGRAARDDGAPRPRR